MDDTSCLEIKCLLSVVCMQVLHTLSCRSRKMIRNDREGIQIELKKKKKKKRLRTPYAYNMNRAILQSVSRNLFYLVSFEKKRKKKRKRKKNVDVRFYLTVQESVSDWGHSKST